ncbi:MAG: sigma-54 dependent transcriptional regulator [Tannerella sp.]|jgi:two-component system NtrC family response regulator|nr:sigma-54 dependent transcriptional regulator [Tannerella sp.]
MILIIDDDVAVRSSLEFVLRRAGYEATAVSDPDTALSAVRTTPPELILMDMNFSRTTTGEEGLHLLRRVKILQPDMPVILITAWGSISLAVEGMRAGAFDFVTKPWNNMVLINTIRTALELNKPEQNMSEQNQSNKNMPNRNRKFDKIIGRSDALMRVLSTVSRIAPTQASVLITGENGTGKELIAEAIHANSPRADKPFVKVNLGGVSQSLFESEMFGHRKGAFTDAVADRSGRFEMADKGTIFLDEIGELDIACQVKLLRVLQDSTFEPLGESRPRRTDVRVVSATNADLRRMIAERTFREDLFYRINLISIHLPPLRERCEDIPLLAQHFADRLTKQQGIPRVIITDKALKYLEKQPFYGNIRELKNLTERAILISGKKVIDVKDFENNNDVSASRDAATTGLPLDEMEKRSVVAALKNADGNFSKAAKTLGISRPALYRRMEKYGIK